MQRTVAMEKRKQGVPEVQGGEATDDNVGLPSGQLAGGITADDNANVCSKNSQPVENTNIRVPSLQRNYY